MRLVSFSAHDFRSIKSTPKLPLSRRLTALLGPNNEGKSNILRAFAVAMQLLEVLRRPISTSHASGVENGDYSIRTRLYDRRIYDWEKDYPVDRQEAHTSGRSSFAIEFELSPEEIVEFREFVGSNLNEVLPVELAVDREWAYFKVLKPGRGAKALSKKAALIARFIGRKLDFHYIPAVRTSENALKVVDELVERELRTLEREAEYVNAIQKIETLQSPVLRRISEALTATLQTFLPEVKSADVGLSADRRYRAFRRSTELVVDDGTATHLSAKGDGVQSLAAISLIRHAVTVAAGSRNLVLAVEEPESHIHPGAMHGLREVLDEIASQHQVIVTTHSPVFVQRKEIGANILVQRQKARAVKHVDEIRESLGVRVEDNLRNSEFALVVEGEEDRTAIQSLLSHNSAILQKAFTSNRLGIDTLGGATNLAYKLSQLRMSLCDVYVLLDDDDAGRNAVDKAIGQGLLEVARVTLTSCKDMTNAEIEDWYDPAVYSAQFREKYGAILESPHYINHRDKWSGRVQQAFKKLGKPWNQFIEMEMKHNIAKLVAKLPENALKPNRRSAFDGLVKSLEELVNG